MTHVDSPRRPARLWLIFLAAAALLGLGAAATPQGQALLSRLRFAVASPEERRALLHEAHASEGEGRALILAAAQDEALRGEALAMFENLPGADRAELLPELLRALSGAADKAFRPDVLGQKAAEQLDPSLERIHLAFAPEAADPAAMPTGALLDLAEDREAALAARRLALVVVSGRSIVEWDMDDREDLEAAELARIVALTAAGPRDLRVEALVALHHFLPMLQPHEPALLELVQDPDLEVSARALTLVVLQEAPSPRVLEQVERILHGDRREAVVCAAAFAALVNFGQEPRFDAPLRRLVEQDTMPQAATLVLSLPEARRPWPGLRDLLIGRLDEPRWRGRIPEYLQALIKLGANPELLGAQLEAAASGYSDALLGQCAGPILELRVRALWPRLAALAEKAPGLIEDPQAADELRSWQERSR